MYEIKPILDQRQIKVELPTCMYKIKPVYDNNSPVQTLDALTNGVVSQYSSNSSIQLPDISQQIRNVLKVFTPTTTILFKLHHHLNDANHSFRLFSFKLTHVPNFRSKFAKIHCRSSMNRFNLNVSAQYLV